MPRLILLCLLPLSLVLGACGKHEASDQGEPITLVAMDMQAAQDMSGMRDLSAAPDLKEMRADMGADMSADMSAGSPFSFPGEQVPCAMNPGFEEAKSVLAGGKINPTGRGEQAAIFDPCHERIVLFGGNDNQPQQCNSFGDKTYLGDTWAYSMAYENWYRVRTSQAPPARGRHASAFDLSRKRLYIFGGRFRPASESGTYTLFNDLWAFDVNTDTWTQLEQRGPIPGERVNSGMIYDPVGDQLVLFGGNSSRDGLQIRPLDDTHIFDLKTQTWREVESLSAPPARNYHAMALDTNRNQVLVFSGGDENAFFGQFYADLWALKLDTMTWSSLWKGTGTAFDPLRGRINAGLIFDAARDRALLFGGHDDTSLGNANDLWAFSMERQSWSALRKGDVYTGDGCASFCSCSETFVTYDTQSPERRQYPTFVKVEGRDQALLFSGTGDCGYMDDTWSLALDSMTWSEVHPAEQGIACARTGRSDCEELCY